MNDPTLIDIYYPGWSAGTTNSATILKEAIIAASGRKLKCRLLKLGLPFLRAERRDDPPPPGLDILGRVAIFMERLFARPYLSGYESLVLIPNPEWLMPDDAEIAQALIDTILHKSRLSLERLSKDFHRARHHLVGFTSFDPVKTVDSYTTFSHFRGSSTKRHTQQLIDLWQARPDLPQLSIQAYGSDIAIRVKRWAGEGNLRFFLDYFPAHTDYFIELARGGIHLCTSATEGFGHYINESRAMSALVLALDGAPMNELITRDTGILIPTTGTRTLNAGLSFTTSYELIEAGVDKALSLSPAERLELGRNARTAYEADRRAFLYQLRVALQAMKLID